MLSYIISACRQRLTSRSSSIIDIQSLAAFRCSHTKMSTPGPVETAIREALTDGLNPTHIEVINESYMHGVPKGSESHFKVLVVSEQFEGTPLIKRHRMVNDLVTKKLDGDFVHALSIVTKTPAQYDPSYKVEPSPNCRGGFGK